MTLGCSVKSGVELTNPVSFTTRRRRSMSPSQAAFTCARSDTAQDRAASAPPATSMPSPSRPVRGLPSRAEIWP